MLNKHTGRWRAAPSDVQKRLCSQVDPPHIIHPGFLQTMSNSVITDTKNTLVLKNHLQNEWIFEIQMQKR